MAIMVDGSVLIWIGVVLFAVVVIIWLGRFFWGLARERKRLKNVPSAPHESGSQWGLNHTQEVDRMQEASRARKAAADQRKALLVQFGGDAAKVANHLVSKERAAQKAAAQSSSKAVKGRQGRFSA
jgi:hypothetical protein